MHRTRRGAVRGACAPSDRVHRVARIVFTPLWTRDQGCENDVRVRISFRRHQRYRRYRLRASSRLSYASLSASSCQSFFLFFFAAFGVVGVVGVHRGETMADFADFDRVFAGDASAARQCTRRASVGAPMARNFFDAFLFFLAIGRGRAARSRRRRVCRSDDTRRPSTLVPLPVRIADASSTLFLHTVYIPSILFPHTKTGLVFWSETNP